MKTLLTSLLLFCCVAVAVADSVDTAELEPTTKELIEEKKTGCENCESGTCAPVLAEPTQAPVIYSYSYGSGSTGSYGYRAGGGSAGSYGMIYSAGNGSAGGYGSSFSRTTTYTEHGHPRFGWRLRQRRMARTGGCW